MGRKSIFDDRDVFAAVGRNLVRDGEFRIQSIVSDTGVSIGSLYHRYGSKEGLLARAWLDAVEDFQARFAAALCEDGDCPGLEAALSVPQFCRSEPDRAVILTCCRRSELLSESLPPDLQARLAAVNDGAKSALQGFCSRTDISIETARLGLVGIPLGAVRLYLPDQPVPVELDAQICAAYRAVVASDRRK